MGWVMIGRWWPWVWWGRDRGWSESNCWVWLARAPKTICMDRAPKIICMDRMRFIPSACLSTFHSLARYCRFASVSTGLSFLVSPSPAPVIFPKGSGRFARYACLDGKVGTWHHPGIAFAHGSIRLTARPIAETPCFFAKTAGFGPIIHSIPYLGLSRVIVRSCWLLCLVSLSSQFYCWYCDLFGFPSPLTSALHLIFHH